MKIKAILTAVAGMSLVAAPTMVAAAPLATPLTQPATEQVDGENSAIAGGAGIAIAALAVAAAGLGIYSAVDSGNDDNDSSVSP